MAKKVNEEPWYGDTLCMSVHYHFNVVKAEPRSLNGMAKMFGVSKQNIRTVLKKIGHTPDPARAPKRAPKAILSYEERHEKFRIQCADIAAKNPDRLPGHMRKQFFLYWTEGGDPGDPKKKMRFEKEKTFEIGARMDRWKLNDYGNKPASASAKAGEQAIHRGNVETYSDGI